MPATPFVLRPPATLLEGPAGTGKTTSLLSFIPAGVELFVLITEGRGADSLLDEAVKAKVDMSRLHYAQVSASPAGWGALTEMGKKVGAMDYQQLSKLSAIGKESLGQYLDLIGMMQNFVDQRGVAFGDISKWDDTRAFVVDSLTGVSNMAMNLTIGYKPTAHEGEWGVAMNLEKKLLETLTNELKCHLVVTAHVDKEPNLITGSIDVMLSALGRKNAPKISPMFSDVVLTKKVKDQFLWSTAEMGVDTKNRSLPLSDKIVPGFGQIVDAYKKRKAANAAVPA